MATESPGQLPGLTPGERELLKKVFSSPLDIPIEFKSWLVSWLGTNPPAFSLSQFAGVENIPRLVTGRVSGAGAIMQGSGFSVARTSAGNYTLTFDPAFAATPIIIAVAEGAIRIVDVGTPGPSGCTISLADSFSTTADAQWSFIASQTL